MARFYGKIGFADTSETTPGVWTESIIEKTYSGDLVRDTRRMQSSSGLNDNINISNNISILADPYSSQHIHLMRYVEFMGTKWKITNVEVQYPRLLLTLGGVYNE